MSNNYKITRQQIVEAAQSMLGIKFKHQGRNPDTGLDCIGFIVRIGEILNYPQIFDKTDYRRMPSTKTTLKYLRKNLDEIPVEDAIAGDLYVIRLHGGRMTHVGVRVSDEIDVEKGIHPQFIHAYASGFKGAIRADFVHKWEQFFVMAFKLRGLTD